MTAPFMGAKFSIEVLVVAQNILRADLGPAEKIAKCGKRKIFLRFLISSIRTFAVVEMIGPNGSTSKSMLSMFNDTPPRGAT
jgi:hypothetical protein